MTATRTGEAHHRLTDALHAAGRRVENGGSTAQCPAHDDHTASLTIGTRNDGNGVTIYCHAGCTANDIVAAVGLRLSDLYDQPQTNGSKPVIVATYDYVDETGGLLWQKLRYVPKDFRQRAADGAWSLKGVRRVLYRLPELLASDGPVYLCEGEKDADAMIRAGVVATAWTEGAWKPGGAPKWRREYTELLAGRDVIIVRDRDEAGENTAATIADLIRDSAASVRIVEAAEGNDAADHLAAGRTVADLVEVAGKRGRQGTNTGNLRTDTPPDEPKQGAAAALVDIALDRYRLGVTSEGEPFGVPLDRGHVIRQLRGGRGSLRAELAAAYRRDTRKVAPQQALADALLALEGEAQDGDPEKVHLRVAEHDGELWIDLGDAAGHAVRVAGGRWEVVTDDVPVLFRRSALTGQLPIPEPGDLAELWDLLNVAEDYRPLVLAWLVMALAVPDAPHPILNVHGEQGTGKSTASRLLVDMVDPSPVELRKPPRDMDSWVTAAAGSWVVGLDNLSTVPDWLSDTLCRASTGDGDVRRQLYTDGDLAVFAFRRVVLINGIDLGGLRGDLAERLLNVALHTIPDTERLTEREMKAAWAAARPRLFGALLDVVSRVKAALPSVRLATSPRMADFAEVLACLDSMHGTRGLDRYLAQSRTLAADSLTSDPFIARMVQTLRDPFDGTAAELLAMVAPAEDRPPKGWPTAARAVTGLLKRHAPALRRTGWEVTDLGASNKNGVTQWAIRPEIARKSSTPSPPSPPNGGQGSTGACRVHPDTPASPGACWTCDREREAAA